MHIFYVKFSTYLFFGVVKQQYRIDWTQIILLQNNSILSKVSKFFTIDGGLIKVTNFCSWEVLNLTSALAHKLEFLNMHRTIVLRNIFNRFLQSSRKGYNIRFWKKGLEKKIFKTTSASNSTKREVTPSYWAIVSPSFKTDCHPKRSSKASNLFPFWIRRPPSPASLGLPVTEPSMFNLSNQVQVSLI